MVTGTGLDGQFGYKGEATVGTEVTVDKFVEILSESMTFDPSWIEPEGLRAGQKFKRAVRLVQGRKNVKGSVEMRYSTRLMGGFWRCALGSSVTTPTLIAGTAYKQVHQIGDILGKSMTVQIGRPEPSGTVRAFTYKGVKVDGWEWSLDEGDVAKFKLDLDGWDENLSTALASASYLATSAEFNSTQVAAFTLGGTISGTTELTVSGGTAVTTVIKSISIKGDNALDAERFGLGNSGVKKEQLENGIPTIMIELDAEFDKTTFYDVFKAGTVQAFYLRVDGNIISGTDKESIEFLAPAVVVKDATPALSGPEIVRAKVSLEVYQNSANNAPFQVKIVSADSTSII